MKQTELRWHSSDNLSLYAKIWEGESQPKAVVNIVHGLGDHINRFNRLAASLVDEGYAVTGIDLRGHGQSEGKRGHTPSYAALLEDIGVMVGKSHERYPEVPMVLFGQSMGGALAINYALHRKETLHCIIASSPWLKLTLEVPEIKIFFGRIFQNLLPGLLQPSGLDADYISSDPEICRQYREDPLVHDRISLKLGYSAIQEGLWAIEHAGELDIPLLLMHGNADKLTSADASREFAANAKKFTTLKIWEGMQHELRHEPDHNKVFQYMLNYIRIYTELEEPVDI